VGTNVLRMASLRVVKFPDVVEEGQVAALQRRAIDQRGQQEARYGRANGEQQQHDEEKSEDAAAGACRGVEEALLQAVASASAPLDADEVHRREGPACDRTRGGALLESERERGQQARDAPEQVAPLPGRGEPGVEDPSACSAKRRAVTCDRRRTPSGFA